MKMKGFVYIDYFFLKIKKNVQNLKPKEMNSVFVTNFSMV